MKNYGRSLVGYFKRLLDKGIDLLDDCEIESSHSPVVFYEIKKVDCLDGQFARVQKSFFC